MVAKTAWALATVSRLERTMFAMLGFAMERRASEFNTQELANTAWVCATVVRSDEKLFALLAGGFEEVNSQVIKHILRQPR